MSKLPITPPGEHYEKNTKEQYEMLGRFVEAFEQLVNEVRQLCLLLAARDGRNAILVQTILHHELLSAKPLFDILRALVVEVLRDCLQEMEDRANNIHNAEPPLLADADGNPISITVKDRDTFFGILSFIHGKYADMANFRNDLLHGTWFVGFSTREDPNSAEFFISRLKTSKRGLSRPEGLPKTASELKTLVERCEDIRYWIGYIEECLQGLSKITEVFEKKNKTWWLIIHPGNATTLP